MVNQPTIIVMQKQPEKNMQTFYRLRMFDRCLRHGLDVCATLTYKSFDEVDVFKQLIALVARYKQKVHVVVDTSVLSVYACIIPCSILGTLQKAGLITLHTIEEQHRKAGRSREVLYEPKDDIIGNLEPTLKELLCTAQERGNISYC